MRIPINSELIVLESVDAGTSSNSYNATDEELMICFAPHYQVTAEEKKHNRTDDGRPLIAPAKRREFSTNS